MKKLLIKLALLAVPMLAAAQTADDLKQSLPSEWGGWQNLTYGVTDITAYSKILFPMEVETSGKTIHLLWQENGKDADGLYRMYYRRSADLGLTWEEAKVISTSKEKLYRKNNHLLAVNGSSVYIFCPSKDADDRWKLRFARSTDGGASFTTVDLEQFGTGSVTQHLDMYYAGCDGQTLVFATHHSDGTGRKELRAYTSTDGGQNFQLLKWQLEGYPFGERRTYPSFHQIADLQVQNGKWTMVCWDDDKSTKVLLNSSSDGGKTLVTQNVTQRGTGRYNYWDNMPGYRPQMVMQGNTIDLIYYGKLDDGDEEMIVYQRSTDSGKTWGEPKYLPDSYDSGTMTIAGKGDNLYVMGYRWTGENDRWGRVTHRTLWYSHDGGKTWQQQRRCFDTYELNNSAFRFTIAPDDPSGRHVIVTGEQGFYMETKDGFETVCRNFRKGDQSWDPYRDRNNEALTVLFDSEGTEHWFMQYSPHQAGIASYDGYFWNICHRRVERPEVPAKTKEMAYHLANTVRNDIIIPMSPSIEATGEAITVEAWVRFDAPGGLFTFASLNNNSASLGGSNGFDGWYLEFYYMAGGATPGGYSFNGCVHPEKSNGSGLFTPWTYLIREIGQWHHVAMTYDSNVAENNVHFYIDGLPYNTRTEHSKILMGNNPILIGRSGTQNDGDVLIDNFAIYSRALTLDEIHQHIYGKPDATDKDCRLLLTFDGTLRDQSQYHNDPVPLMDAPLVEHNGINLPKADFTLTKDAKGTTVYVNDVTPDGEVYWWFKPSPTTLGTFNESWKKHESVNYNGHSGHYTFWMVAKGDGETTNAFAPVKKDFTISGLNKVFPNVAGQSEWVKLRIQGGYKLTNSNKPKVVLKQGDTEIEGNWDLPNGYNHETITSMSDLAPAVFNLAAAPVGKYDVIVGTDTLFQAFSLEAVDEAPTVWLRVNGNSRMLYNRWKAFSIDYGNTSNVDAYNTPIYLFVPHEGIDVVFDFEYNYMPTDYLDPKAIQWANDSIGLYQVFDNEHGNKMRCYSFTIPYIGANSQGQKTFRIRKMANNYDEEVRIAYAIASPWGPYDVEVDESANTRSGDEDKHSHYRSKTFSTSQIDCIMTYLATGVVDAAASAVPFGSCVWGVGKTIYQGFSHTDDRWSTLGTNLFSTAFSCAMDFNPLGWGWRACQLANIAFNTAMNIYGANGCTDAKGGEKRVRSVQSIDPNEMIGPWGPDDDKHYIQPIHQMPYMITFENKSTASAPANEVFVTDTLDLLKFDAETFSFSSFGWADTTFVVGGSRTQEFTRDVNYKVNGHDILVRVSGQFNPAMGVANWSFASLEKNGNELNDVMNGFLLPNDQIGRGEGFVSFIIDHKANPANGSTISNKATIVFDANEPIVTNTYTNTFDTDYPTSKVVKAEEPSEGKLTVTVSGSDQTSGIDHYTVFAQKNGGEWLAVATITDGTTCTIDVETGTKYGLCAIATDQVGLNEPKGYKVEAELTTGGTAPVTATYDLRVADAGYATFYDSKADYQLPAGLKASTVSGVSGDRLTYQPLSGSIVPKGTAVLIEANEKKAATYTLTGVDGGSAGSTVGTNLLHGSDDSALTGQDVTTPDDYLYYKLAYGPAGTSLATQFGWFWGSPDGMNFNINGHRAWLAVPKTAGARAYLIDGEATPIESLDLSTGNEGGSWTDLQGRRITIPTQPGIYLKNNRKVVIK
ncbi:MAG: hypothetical protein K5683_09115 [Prevotella sp.]|nr:hypothetical protein [Prevotella sp.]